MKLIDMSSHMGNFDDFVSKVEVALPILPLCHTSEASNFMTILKEKRLNVSKCPNFKKPLLYFFYGRPAFRPESDGQSTSTPMFMPVAIIVKPESLLQRAESMAPFDTGAYGMYSKHIDSKMNLEDFLMTPNLETLGRVVKCFFDNNMNYYVGLPMKIDIPPSEFVADSYHKLIHDSPSPCDDRRSSIEVQFKEPLPLNQKNVLLVVLPKVFLDDKIVRQTIMNEWGADVRGYLGTHASTTIFVERIFREVEGYLKSENYI